MGFDTRNRSGARRAARSAVAAALAFQLAGCASMFGQYKQIVTIKTNPPQRTILYGKNRYADGQSIPIQKTPKAPQANVGTLETPVMVDLKYTWDRLILLNILNLGVGFIVDFGSGCWRKLDSPQVINVPASAPMMATPAPSPTPAPAETPKPKTTPKPKSSGKSKSDKPKTDEPDTGTSPIAP